MAGCVRAKTSSAATLASLGGEFTQFASDDLPFDGAYVDDNVLKGDVPGREWLYALFWARVSEPGDEKYALARSGLWSATPNTADCTRGDPALTLVIGRHVTKMSFDGETVHVTAREAPGHFEYIEYSLPDKNRVGWALTSEDGEWLDGCCS